MARYRLEGSIVDTERASRSWKEDTEWDGNNHISKATGSQWDHQMLYRSRKGRYYVENTSQWESKLPSAEWVSPQEATRWLLVNNHELPEELEQYEDEVCE